MFAAAHIATSATVVSDGLWCFRATTIIGAEHERIVTGGGKASVKLPQFKAVNTLLGNLKTAISGTYHAFDFAKYAHRYLAEFQYRFNRRFNMAPSSSDCFTPWSPPRHVRSIGFGLLRFIANQVSPSGNAWHGVRARLAGEPVTSIRRPKGGRTDWT